MMTVDGYPGIVMIIDDETRLTHEAGTATGE
jgi:hypothetical protein